MIFSDLNEGDAFYRYNPSTYNTELMFNGKIYKEPEKFTKIIKIR